MPEKTEQVELTLEESGTLCHLLMQAMLKDAPPSKLLDLTVTNAVTKRMAALYDKLAAVNDKLMGKPKSDN